MEIKDMNLEEVIARMNAISEELNGEGADIEALETETNALIERKASLIAQKKADVKAVIEDQGETITENVERTHTMENVITRNSPEYINAYAEAIKNQDDKIVRSLLTENVPTGTIAVPDVVANFVKEAWESNEIWRRVPKTFLKGNYKIQFEINAPIAVAHIEGTDPISEENLQMGIVNLQPVYFKKYVKVSDEAMSLTGEAFLQYIYAELTDRIIAAIINSLMAAINASNAATVGIPHSAVIQGAIANTDIINAIGQLKGELRDVVVMTSRSAYAQYKALQFSASYGIDVFDGLPVLFTDQLPTGVRAIVGSLRDGAHANLPNGQEVEFKIDDTSLALTSADMVGILGRMYVGIGVVRDGAFCVIKNQA
jgi:HK97 family phage major capsid protein